MSSPNEPGPPRGGDGPRHQRCAPRSPETCRRGHAAARHATPPGSAAQDGPAAAAATEAHAQAGTRRGTPLPSDARLNRFISGGPAARACPRPGPPAPAPAREPEAAPSPATAHRHRAARRRTPASCRTCPAPVPARRSATKPGGERSDHRNRRPRPHRLVARRQVGRGAARPGAGQHADPAVRPVERAEGLAGAVGGTVLRVDDRRRIPLPRARRHGRVEQAQQQRRRPADQRERQRRRSWCPAAPSSAARR